MSFFLKPPASSAATTSGLFGSASAQPSGGIFGSATPQPTGGLFGGSTGGQQQNQQTGGLFGNAGSQQQTQPSGGMFGNSTGQQQQQQQSGGLFGINSATQQQPQQSTNMFGNTSGLFNKPAQQQQSQQPTGGLFSNTGGLFRNTTSQPAQQSSFFGNNLQPPKANSLNLSAGADPSLSRSGPGSRTAIDLEHLRPTTKFDALAPSLQSEIEAVESHILSEGAKCREISEALPSIIQAGGLVPQTYEFVREKFDELSLALENDAADIVELRDRVVRRDVAEGRLCWKSVDRLKMPSQYQTRGHHGGGGGGETVYGGAGLSGWWNNPTMSTRNRHNGQKNVVVEEESELEIAGGTLVDLLNGRVDEMAGMLADRRELLGEVEGFVGNVEGKIHARERELVDGIGGTGERDRQIRMLRYVFGEVERGLYEVAERVGESRERVMELGERRVGTGLGMGF